MASHSEIKTARRLRRCYLAGPVAQHHLASHENPVTQPFNDGRSRHDRDEHPNIEGISRDNSWTLYTCQFYADLVQSCEHLIILTGDVDTKQRLFAGK